MSPSGGAWSEPLNWSSPLVAGPTTALTFAPTGTQSYTATDDLAGPFVLNQIVLAGTSGGSVTIGAGSLSSFRFAGSSASIQSSLPGAGYVVGEVELASDLAVTGSVGAGTVGILGAIRGAGKLTVDSLSSNAVVIGGANRYTGGTELRSGRLDLGHQDALGQGMLTANGGVITSSLDVTPSGNAPHFPFIPNAVVSTGAGLGIGGNHGFTLTGAISGTSGVNLSPSNVLDATWTLTGANSFSGPIVVGGSATPGVTSTLYIASPAALGNASSISINGAGARLLLGTAGSAPAVVSKPLSVGPAGAQLGAFTGGTVARVNYAGSITGSGTLSSSGNGVLTLSGSNAFGGPLVLMSGVTSVQSNANLGAPSSTISLAGGALLLDSPFTASSRNINVSTSGSTIYALGTSTLSGVISNALTSGLSVGGAGTLILNGANTFNDHLTVNGGTLMATGISGRFVNTAAGNAGSITVNDGATVVFDNVAINAARIHSASSITLNGGDLRFLGNATGHSSLNAPTGSLTIGNFDNAGAGLSLFRIDPGAAANARATFSTLSKTYNNGTMVRFAGNGLGQNSIASLTPNAANVQITGGVLLDDGILPWAVVDTNDGNVDFATYSAANGIRRYTSYTAGLGGGGLSNALVGSAAIASGTTAVNSLKMTGGTVNLSAGTLHVYSGGILSTGAATLSGGTLVIGVDGSTLLGAPIGHFHTDGDLNVTSRIVTFHIDFELPTGIAKAGPGGLTLSSVNTYRGPTRILSGTLRLGTNNAVTTTSQVMLAPGATYDLNGFNSTIGSLNQTGEISRIASQPGGTVIVGGNALTVGGDNNSTAVSHNFIGNGNIVKNGTGTMTVIGHQSFTGTLTINNGAMVLGTNHIDGTGFANVARINLGAGAPSGDCTLAYEYGLPDGYAVPITVNVPSVRTATLKFLSSPEGSPGITFNSNIDNAGSTGLVIDSSAGTTIAGVISSIGALTTASSEGLLAGTQLADGPDGFALNITGNNTYTGATTLTAISTLFGSATAFGNASSAIGLGSTTGFDAPEVASSAGGLTMSRNFVVNGSTNVVPDTAYIGSRAPAGSGTTTYFGTIGIAGSRSRLVLFSLDSPVAFTNVISGGTPQARVQVGRSFGPGLETTRSDVILGAQNTYAGGTELVAGSLGFAESSVSSGSIVVSGPVGTGTLTIGTSETAPGYGPTLYASAAPRTIDNPVLVQSNFSVSGGAPLTLGGPVNLGDGARAITVDDLTTLNITAPIVGNAGSALVKQGGGTLVLGADNAYAGPMVAGAGTLALNTSQHLGGQLAVAGGATVRLTAGGTTKLIRTPSVFVDTATGSRLDLADHAMIVDYSGASPASSVNALLASGYASGAWNGPGVMSSSLPSGGSFVRALGLAEASAFSIGSFLGEPVDATAILVRYTLAGDVNLDALVDITDLGVLATNWQLTGRLWYQGDFNFDGMVDITDLGLLATNWQQSISRTTAREFLSAMGFSGHAVPEPAAALCMLPLAIASRSVRCARHRRR
jgi:autotransporter-associated beta strand protein